MKTWTSTTAVVLGLGLAATAISSTSAAPVMFNRHFMAGNAKHSNRIEFNTVEMEPVPHYMLADAGKLGDELHPMCKYTETNSTTQANTTVLIAISKCLNDSSIKLIEQWIDTLKATEFVTGRDGVKTPLTFATTLVQGDCEAHTEREISGREEDIEDDEDDSAETRAIKKAKRAIRAAEKEEEKKAEEAERARQNAEKELKTPKLLSADLSKHLLSQQVHPDELVRIEAFAKFGRVLADAPSMANTQTPIAVVSFVNNKNSYDYVEKYENRYQIKNTFNFQLCEGGENCDGKYENCVKLKENIELFMFNPFQVVRSFGCNDLDGSIPVTYVDAKGNRACYCRCPAGFESTSDSYHGPKKCAQVEPDQCPCVWNDGTKPHANKICNEENLKVCKFTDLASKWKVAVPFPLDNYVSDERVNSKDAKGDDVTKGPHIDLVVTPLYKNEYTYSDLEQWHKQKYPYTDFVLESLPPSDDEFKGVVKPNPSPSSTTPASTSSFTWRVYQDDSQGKIDDIELKAYGKYQLELGAYDYARNAKCVGCVAVVDKFRPVNTTQCPVRVCDNSTGLCHESNRGNVEYTDANLATLNGLVDSFYNFQSKSTNDACNTKRCDDEKYELQNWFESSAAKQSKFKDGKTCFSKSEIEKDFMGSTTATTNPLVDEYAPNGVKQNDKPVNANQCTRCCQYGVKLQELWTDYKCNYEYDVEQCSGNNDDKNSNCALKQCVVLKGDTLASVTAKIKPSVTEESEKVLAKLESQGFQTYTQVHRALQCTGFGQTDGKCDYSAKIGELLDVKVDNRFGDEKADYVFWRYKVKGEDWRLWNPSDEYQTTHKFSTAATKITLEAWTACGRARKFYFYVHLHVHSDIKVCDYFNDMWYQTTVSRAKIGEKATDALCAYPGSDFAELTFDYQANIGLKHARDQLRMNVTGVECKLTFTDRTDAQIVSVKGESMDIIERFAVELQNQATTAATTAFNVECKFTYTRFDQEKLTHKCQRAFTIQDCDAPTIDTPPGECLYDDCAGQGKPGPYEVCDGNVVSATATATYMTTGSSTCCESCKDTTGKKMKSTCTTILDLPTGAQDKDIKRCVPKVPEGVYIETGYGNGIAEPTYGNENEYSLDSMMLLAKAAATTHSTAMGLLAASAMVAVVALVAVRQRRAQAARDTMIVDDAYYPLLH